ncbi:MAG: 3-isopropylmalate dehydratase large subunit, partial [Pseudomonadales bacterium]|nr:3-isopropylmalate dehydratase large subunit [Pseudomonadales bacterium]
MAARTLYDKIWDAHLVGARKDGNSLIYIDLQLLHEVTSPQAFEGLTLNKRPLWRVDANLATPDHNVPTDQRELGMAGITDTIALQQVTALDDNCKSFGVEQFEILDPRQGIVHVVGPEQGATLPGMTIVCGDSHTSTHGAFAALAQGVGTSEVEHVMATQCLVQNKAKNYAVEVNGELSPGVYAKDLILAIIARLGTAGATGHTIEYRGSTIRALSMEARMTLCNMSIEAGARAGLVAVDQTTLDYVKGRPFAPSGDQWEAAQTYWRTLVSDADAIFDNTLQLRAEDIPPQVSWGTSPEQVAGIDEVVPDPGQFTDPVQVESAGHALKYMDLPAGKAIKDIYLDQIFIGSCTNARIEDLRAVAAIVRGKKLAANIKQALIVPGSGLVKAQAEAEGLAQIFVDAGFSWRAAGCSMCLAMNPDKLGPKEH